jgi:uncharacterized membrane protein
MIAVWIVVAIFVILGVGYAIGYYDGRNQKGGS